MELDELKIPWLELNERLDVADRRLERMAARIAAEKINSSLDRLRRMNRMLLVVLASLPFSYLNLCRSSDTGPGTFLSVWLALFLCAMSVCQIRMLVLLNRIRPDSQSVRETCEAVLRLRRCFLAGTVAGIVLAVPLLVALGLFVVRMTMPYALYGFGVGLVAGLLAGLRVFLRAQREIGALQAALDGE